MSPFFFYIPSSIHGQPKESKVLINQFLQSLALFFRNFLHNIFQIIDVVVPCIRVPESNWQVVNRNIILRFF